MNLLKFLIIKLLVISIISCTRNVEQTQIKIQLPKQPLIQSSVTISANTATTNGSPWEPTLTMAQFSDINCYLVFVGAPDPQNSYNYCLAKGAAATDPPLVKFGIYAGAVPSGGEIILNIPSGPSRVITLLGMKANAGYCKDFHGIGAPQGQISYPKILGKRVLDLAPGDARVSFSISDSQVAVAQEIDHCEISDMPVNTNNPPPGNVVTGPDLMFKDTFYNASSSEFGRSVAIGDLNNDGYDDFIMGAPFDSNNGSNAGAVYVYSGFDLSLHCSYLGTNPDDNLGQSVAVGDTDGDGDLEIVVGAPGSDLANPDGGAVFVINGLSTGTCLFEHSIYLPIPAAGDKMGYSLAVGNVAAGSTPATAEEILIGAPFASNGGVERGYVRVMGFNGSSYDQHTLLNGTGGNNDRFGFSLAANGDINGDGINDVIVGAPQTTGLGYVHVFYGNAVGLFGNGVDQTVSFGSSGEKFGFSVSAAPDSNADGKDEILIGAPFSSSGGANSGEVFYVNGADSSVLQSRFGPSGFQMGTSLGVISTDIIAIGAPGATNAANDTQAGRVIIYNLNTQQEVLFREANGPFKQLGTSLCVKNSKVLVGAPDASPNGEVWGFEYMP